MYRNNLINYKYGGKVISPGITKTSNLFDNAIKYGRLPSETDPTIITDFHAHCAKQELVLEEILKKPILEKDAIVHSILCISKNEDGIPAIKNFEQQAEGAFYCMQDITLQEVNVCLSGTKPLFNVFERWCPIPDDSALCYFNNKKGILNQSNFEAAKRLIDSPEKSEEITNFTTDIFFKVVNDLRAVADIKLFTVFEKLVCLLTMNKPAVLFMGLFAYSSLQAFEDQNLCVKINAIILNYLKPGVVKKIFHDLYIRLEWKKSWNGCYNIVKEKIFNSFTTLVVNKGKAFIVSYVMKSGVSTFIITKVPNNEYIMGSIMQGIGNVQGKCITSDLQYSVALTPSDPMNTDFTSNPNFSLTYKNKKYIFDKDMQRKAYTFMIKHKLDYK